MRTPYLTLAGVCLLAWFLSGCQGTPQQLIQAARRESFFLPPTSAVMNAPQPVVQPTATAANTSIPIQILPTPTPQCEDNLSFVADVTVPDGTEVIAGSQVDKRWQVANSGSCNWDQRYTIRYIAGDVLGAQPEYVLYPARSGTQATLRILFTAPLEAGSYRSAWQAYSSDETPFGDPIFMEIEVVPAGE